ncbi:MAG TPA: stage III sporulation protein AD [Pseudogracilibacillus sp.]|nr:stage III sporulation protein AD [Pseudogracilibacillus sp.]
MDIVQIILIGIVATLLYIILKDIEPAFAYLLLLITSIFILVVVIQQIHIIIQMIQSLGNKAQINSVFIETILKIIGIAYITELGSNVMKDANLTSIAAKVELAGKIFILLLAVPIITTVVETIIQFIPTSSWQMP